MNYYSAYSGFEISSQSRESLEACGVRRIDSPSYINKSDDICFCFYADPCAIISYHYQNDDEDVFATVRFYRNFLSNGGDSVVFIPSWIVERLDIFDPQTLIKDVLAIQNEVDSLPPLDHFSSFLLNFYGEKYSGLCNVYQEIEALAKRGSRLPDSNYLERVLSFSRTLSFGDLKMMLYSNNFIAENVLRTELTGSHSVDLQYQNNVMAMLIDSLIEEVNYLECDRKSYSKVLESYVASSSNFAAILNNIIRKS